MKYLASLLLLLPALAFGQELMTVKVIDDNHRWSIQVENCNINPNEEVKVIKRSWPAEKILLRQGGRVFRCDVKRIEVLIS